MPGKRSLGIPCRFSQKDGRELSWNLEEANLTKKKEVRHWEQDSARALTLPFARPIHEWDASHSQGYCKHSSKVSPNSSPVTHLHIWREAEAAFDHGAYGITLNRTF